MSLAAALAACEKLGGHLAYIETQEEQDFLQKLKGEGTRWIGGGDTAREGIFRWLDGSPVSKKLNSKLDRENSPDRDYLFLNNDGYLGARIATGFHAGSRYRWVHGFICEWDY